MFKTFATITKSTFTPFTSFNCKLARDQYIEELKHHNKHAKAYKSIVSNICGERKLNEKTSHVWGVIQIVCYHTSGIICMCIDFCHYKYECYIKTHTYTYKPDFKSHLLPGCRLLQKVLPIAQHIYILQHRRRSCAEGEGGPAVLGLLSAVLWGILTTFRWLWETLWSN